MRGYTCVGLDNPKTGINLGSVMRAAGLFGVTFVAASGRRCRVDRTDPMKAHRHVPLIYCDDVTAVVPYDCVPIAVEIADGAKPLPEFTHPERAYYIFGGEDATLGERIISRCACVLWIPTPRCLNLAAAVNVVLYDRLAKSRQRWSNPDLH